MNLKKKKELAARTLKVGKERISFLTSRLEEIKEAITKQDIKDLRSEGAIRIKEKTGQKRVQRKGKKKGPGNIRKKVNQRKRIYVISTRKLRKHVAEMKKNEYISVEEAKEIRKKIRNRIFKSKAHLKDHIGGLHK